MAEYYKALTNVSLLIYMKDKYMFLGLTRPRNHLKVKLVYSTQISAQVGYSGNLSLCPGPYRASGTAQHTEPALSLTHYNSARTDLFSVGRFVSEVFLL